MNEYGYAFTKEPKIFYYEFFSEGPNGKIRKVIQFQQVRETNNVYNLGFGDFDEETGEVDDLSISNSRDTQKILITVANTVVDFMKAHPNSIVMAKGSTNARTRLYQMGISQFFNQIDALFEIKGFKNGSWQVFEKGENFEAFFIVSK